MKKLLTFILSNLLFSSIVHLRCEAKNIQLTPGNEAYERYMNNQDLEESLYVQRVWILSAICPGAGQFYNDQPWRAAAYWGLLIGLGAGALYCHTQYCKYSHNSDNIGSERSSYESYKDIRDGLILTGILVYVINIFDAYSCAKLTKFELSKDISVEIVPEIKPKKGAVIALNIDIKP